MRSRTKGSLAVLAVMVYAGMSHPHSAAASASAVPGHAAQVAIAYARKQIGKPYVWGGPTMPGTSYGFDCSGLVMEAYATAGVTIERTSQEQWASERQVPASQAQAGDLVFFAGADGTPASPGHVGIIVDPAKDLMIDAYSPEVPIGYATYGPSASLEGLSGVVGYTDPTAGAS